MSPVSERSAPPLLLEECRRWGAWILDPAWLCCQEREGEGGCTITGSRAKVTTVLPPLRSRTTRQSVERQVHRPRKERGKLMQEHLIPPPTQPTLCCSYARSMQVIFSSEPATRGLRISLSPGRAYDAQGERVWLVFLAAQACNISCLSRPVCRNRHGFQGITCYMHCSCHVSRQSSAETCPLCF